MINFLIKKFIKNKDDLDYLEQRKAYGHLASFVGLFINVSLVILKIVVGFLSGSIAIIGDGLNNLSDCFSSIISIISFKVSSKPADEDHPYGHARIEYILSSIVAIFVILIGLGLMKESVLKILHPREMDINAFAIGIMVYSIAIKFWLFTFYKELAHKINSDMLRATSLDSISDVYSTSAILVGILCYVIFKINLDAIIGLIVSVFIVKSGWEILPNIFDKMIGHMPTSEEINRIEDFFHSYEKIYAIHDLMIHDYGPNQKYVTIHVEMDSDEKLMAAHAYVDDIEKKLKEQLGYNVTIHIDPIEIHQEEFKGIFDKVEKIVNGIDENIKIENFRYQDTNKSTYIICCLGFPDNLKYRQEEIEASIESELKKTNDKYELVLVCENHILYKPGSSNEGF